MGVKNWDFIPWRTGELDELSPRAIAIDGPNHILRRIKSFEYKGRPVRERVPTSHVHVVLGIVNAALKRNVLPVFVFDGSPESLKRPSNPELVRGASDLYRSFAKSSDPYNEEIAERLHNSPALRWYFSVNHIKDLCKALGIPALTASSEAEMTAAVMCKNGLVGSVLSNDADALLFGSPHVSKAVRFTQGEMDYTTLDAMREVLGVELEQMRDLAILCGCDFHPGLKGVGPRRGVLLLTRFGSLEGVLKYKGVDPNEREEFLRARETYDESDFISLSELDISLKPPMVSTLERMLYPVMGAEVAEKFTRGIVKVWKGFGQEQTSLEAWI